MPLITYKNKATPLQEGQSVLDALLGAGYSIPHACKQGVCQSCTLKATSGDIPKAAQIGLKPTQQEQGYFLSCLCKPAGDFSISDCQDLSLKTPATLISTTELTPSVYALCLKIDGDFSYKAGQYINLVRPSDQLTRSYSLASTQQQGNGEIELHIKIFEGGDMSTWLSQCPKGTSLDIMGPMGDCFYLPSFKENNLLLLGYGTGLAPLYGILKEALSEGHQGEIHLYHWGNSTDDLYYKDEIQSIVERNPHVFYHWGLETLGSLDAEQHLSGDACATISKAIPSFKDWKIFLCGSENKVNKARRVFYLGGADLSNIYADAFFTWQKSGVQEEKAS